MTKLVYKKYVFHEDRFPLDRESERKTLVYYVNPIFVDTKEREKVFMESLTQRVGLSDMIIDRKTNSSIKMRYILELMIDSGMEIVT